jgi:hypothetical protein
LLQKEGLERSIAFKHWAWGRCFRCLEHDHQVNTCHEPFRCISCRRPGHRERFCHACFPVAHSRSSDSCAPCQRSHFSPLSLVTPIVSGLGRGRVLLAVVCSAAAKTLSKVRRGLQCQHQCGLSPSISGCLDAHGSPQLVYVLIEEACLPERAFSPMCGFGN